MNLKGIISISGKPGLYRVVAQGKNNIIVESLDDKKRIPAYSSDRISALDDISIYTYDEDQALKVIFKSIYDKEKGSECISHKEDQKKLIGYLLEVLPNFDQERVYISDVKKIFQWYNLLHKSGNLKLEEDTEVKEEISEENTSEEKVKSKEKVTTSKTAKKVTPKKKVEVKPKSAPKASSTKKVAAPKTGSSRGK